jgi:hypothetical protein
LEVPHNQLTNPLPLAMVERIGVKKHRKPIRHAASADQAETD